LFIVRKFISRYLPLVVWLVFISYASSDSFNAGNTSRIIGPLVLWLFPNTSPETMATIHFVTRKIAHFTEYAILGFLAARAFRPYPRWFLISAVLVVPSRTASVLDSLIDMAGGITALILVRRKRSV
jgi:VanZ family protein